MAQVKPQQVLESQKKQGGLKGREAQNAQTGKPLFPLMKKSREQVLDMLKSNPDIWHKFQLLTNEFQEELILD